jgi:hypothetical protein
MTGPTPPTGGYGPAQVGIGFPPGPPQPAPYTPSPRRRRGAILIGAGVLLAIALGAAALVLALMSPGRQSSAPTPTTTQQPGSTSDADRALCQAIAPLMKTSQDERNGLVQTGPPGSPGQDAALPKFVTDTKTWASQAQQVLDEHANPPRHLTRTLQRYVDDMLLFVESVRPGPSSKYDEAAWTDSTVAAGGPMAVCYDLGVQW